MSGRPAIQEYRDWQPPTQPASSRPSEAQSRDDDKLSHCGRMGEAS
jgi:hypothetical protein